MTMTKELLLSIISMDVYNRGYSPGVGGLGGLNSQIGTATLISDYGDSALNY
jgi:hypothetical protein